MKLKLFVALICFFNLQAMEQNVVGELREAIESGWYSDVNEVLNKLSEIDRKEILEKAPLIYYALIAKKPTFVMVDQLLKAGANPNIGNPQNLESVPIAIALSKSWNNSSKNQVLNLLIDQPTINLNIAGPKAPIFLALDSDLKQDFLRKLIEKTDKQFLNPKNSKGRPALIEMLLKSEYDELSKLMINKGANVNQVDDTTGITSLMVLSLAKRSNNAIQELIDLLIKHNAAIDAKDKNGQTALMRFAQSDSESILFGLRRLIQYYKAFKITDLINVVDNDGATALIWAASRCTRAITFLVEDGNADIGIKDKSGRDAFSYVIDRGCEAFIKLFVDHGADVSNIDKLLATKPQEFREKIMAFINQYKQSQLLGLQSLTSTLNSLAYKKI